MLKKDVSKVARIEQFFYSKDKLTGEIHKVCFQNCEGPNGSLSGIVLTVQGVQECLNWWNGSGTCVYSLEKP